MKRFITVFLSVYIALIACYPCSDQDTCVDEKRSHVEVNFAGHEHAPVELDLCSPFCICSCCSTHMNEPKTFQLSGFVPAIVEPLSDNKPQTIKLIPCTIWQPPKIA